MDADVDFCRENVVFRSWAERTLDFAIEGPANGLAGLRKSQRAAAFAVLPCLDSDPEVSGAVVILTGTEKTDTIFAIIIAARFRRTLLIVPSDAPRTQIGDRLADLQRLRTINAISDNVLPSIICRIDGRNAPSDVQATSPRD